VITYEGVKPELDSSYTINIEAIPSFPDGMTWNSHSGYSWNILHLSQTTYQGTDATDYTLDIENSHFDHVTSDILSLRLTSTGLGLQIWWSSDYGTPSDRVYMEVTYFTCDSNAFCNAGTCTCNSGFSGDGITCTRTLLFPSLPFNYY